MYTILTIYEIDYFISEFKNDGHISVSQDKVTKNTTSKGFIVAIVFVELI